LEGCRTSPDLLSSHYNCDRKIAAAAQETCTMEDRSQLDAVKKHTKQLVDNVWTDLKRDCKLTVLGSIISAANRIEYQVDAKKK
jgi:hypothetical protein